jgi:hypothetical protein
MWLPGPDKHYLARWSFITELWFNVLYSATLSFNLSNIGICIMLLYFMQLLHSCQATIGCFQLLPRNAFNPVTIAAMEIKLKWKMLNQFSSLNVFALFSVYLNTHFIKSKCFRRASYLWKQLKVIHVIHLPCFPHD